MAYLGDISHECQSAVYDIGYYPCQDWYKGLKTVGCKGKRKAVLLLSIVFLLAVVSGILLVCFVDGANSSLGLWHYRIGIFVSVLGVLHILKRKRGLYKGVRRHVL